MKNWKNWTMAALAILAVVMLILLINANNSRSQLEQKYNELETSCQEAKDSVQTLEAAAAAAAADSKSQLDAAVRERDSLQEAMTQLEGEKKDLQERLDGVTEQIQSIAAVLGSGSEGENMEAAAEAAAETAETAIEATAEAAEATAEAVTEGAEEVKETVTETVTDAAEEAKETIAEAAADAAEEVRETVTEAAEEGKDAAENAAEAPAALLVTHEEYMAAAPDTLVYFPTCVQATQNWWDGKITVYAQSPDGAYFIYNMACSEEDAAKLVPGTPIQVTGFKSEWAGEIEVTDATFEFIEDDPYIAEAEDVTAKLGTDELINCQNEFVAFRGMTVEAYDESGAAFAYKNDVDKTDDLYFKVSKDGQVYDFCVEFYLCGQDTEVYKAVEALNVGDVIDLEGFLYWYNGANPHITKITKAE